MDNIEVKLHPEATFHPVADDRIQLRSPDGRHITFYDDDQSVSNVLSDIQKGMSLQDMEALQEIYSKDFIDGIIAPLSERGLISNGNIWSNESQYSRILSNYLVQGGQVQDIVLPTMVTIRGEGLIAERLAEIFKPKQAGKKQETSHDTLVIIASDTDDSGNLRTLNQELIETGQLGTFFRWRNSELTVGPFVVPQETGCFDCVEHRAIATALHVNEAESYGGHGGGPKFCGGMVLDGLLEGLAQRHINAILSGAWEIAGVGCVFRLNPVTFEAISSPILRLPRCPTCGLVDSERPARAIRDLT